MSPANATSSPRDHDADANPDVARKKQRLSEDDVDSIGEDTVLVEACEPEEIGGTLEHAIEIEDDENIMAPYSVDFWIREKGPSDPVEHIGLVAEEVRSTKYYFQTSEFRALAKWLVKHCNDTAEDAPHQWRHQYLDYDSEFFSRLGNMLWMMLSTYDLFEAADFNKASMRQPMHEFLTAATTLSCRIIKLIPDILNSTLSRRDSALQGSVPAQPVELFQFLGVAARSMPKYSELMRNYQKLSRTNLVGTYSATIASVSRPDVLTALGSIVKMLGGAMPQLKDSWLMFQDVFRIFATVVAHQHFDSFPNALFEEIIGLVKTSILPAICAKHPNALPNGFHNDMMNLGNLCLLKFATTNTHRDIYQAYLRFVKSDEDAILQEDVPGDAVSETLEKISEEDVTVLGQLLATSWTLQAAIAYVRSDIMNIRSLGLHALGGHLRTIFEDARKMEDLDNTFIQHAVRFLRKNEVTKYIFSSDSHASLISESTTVIAFLSATGTYTDQETDVIWRACSTSVEADFVKASFVVLNDQLNNLDFGHALYILKKYGATPIDGLGAAAVEFLPVIYRKLNEFVGPALDQASRLEFAFASIDVLKHVDTCKDTAFSPGLRSILHHQIQTIATTNFTIADRREIYGRYLPEIGEHAPGATTAVEVLILLMNYRLPSEDAEAVLHILPVEAAVEDLQHFVSSSRETPDDPSTISAVILRLGCILRLMSLDPESAKGDVIKHVFDSAFGENALGEAARGSAWDKLHSMTAMKDSPPAAVTLWKVYMQRHVPSLPTELANPRLVELICNYLISECGSDEFQSDYTLLLQHPLWEGLMRFATTSANSSVVDAATAGIGHFLLDYPAHPTTGDLRDSAVVCQRETVRALTQSLEKERETFRKEQAPHLAQNIVRTINFLHALLIRSREFAAFYAPANAHDVVVLDPSADEGNRLSFSLQIYSAAPEPQPQVMSVQASKTTTVLQLLESLRSRTGAAENRVIAGGREITGLTAQTLSEAGVQNAGVIQIRPRYKQGFDFDHLLMSTGPVEKEIVAHFDALESLVDEPSEIAERAVDFIRIVPPTNATRQKVASPSGTAEDLFPKDRLARAQFSIYVIDWHLRDCARIGIADSSFLARGVRLLTSVLMDETRDLLEPITPQVVCCLHAFLQERPASDSTEAYFENGASFVSRMIDRLFEIEGISMRDPARARQMAKSAYDTLLLASQIDDSVWRAFSSSSHLPRLHSQLLLHFDANFSASIAKPIKSLCQSSETPRSITNFFWETIFSCLQDALNASSKSYVFFNLASDVLRTTESIHTDEAVARNLVELLSAALYGYNHTESANDLTQDFAVAGLLKLLSDAVAILKSFKKPLQLNGLSAKIAEHLLFPDDQHSTSRPLIHDDTRTLAYDLMHLTMETSADFEKIVDVTERMTDKSLKQANVKFPGHTEWLRAPESCSGLTNLGMTCYMNSMLQQLFGNIQFRKFILDQPLLYPEKQGLLKELQALFGRMQSSVDPVQGTAALASALGVQVGNQEDVHDFYASLVSKLEDEMPDPDTKLALSKFFTGQSITQIKGCDCGHVSSQKEAFGDLSVTVKNKANLHDSLAEFVQGEPMEGANKYKCMSCDEEKGRLVDAVRRTCLEDVPDCLTVCLKRFTFGSKFLGEGKVNDRFDFPETLDMSMYKRTHLEDPEKPHDPDIFQLVGVIVHQGTLNLGHYWSWVRVPNPLIPGAGDWFYLEDNRTSCQSRGFDLIQQECFGGQRYTNGNERPDNAYVLFYQRKQYIADASIACEAVGGLPKVQLPEPLASDISAHNSWKLRMAALFDDKFANHVCWLLNHYSAFKKDGAEGSDSGSDMDVNEDLEAAAVRPLEARIGGMFANYALRILLSDPACESKLPQTIAAFNAAMTACPKISQHILEVVSIDNFAFEAILLSDSAKLRSAVLDMIKTCIATLRDLDNFAYTQVVQQLLSVHSVLLSRWLDRNPRCWNDYFAFAAFIAKQGSDETCMVLEHRYLHWIIEAIWMSRNHEWKQTHAPLWNLLQREAVDFDPLMTFLHDLLSQHVDLSSLDPEEEDVRTRKQTANGWTLDDLERRALVYHDEPARHRTWMLYELAGPRCFTRDKSWKTHGLSKLIGLLVSDRVDPTARSLITDTLAHHYDVDDQNLTPLLWYTLHYCANTDDSECKDLLQLFGKILPLWFAERLSLQCLADCYEFAPTSVLNSALHWARPFILSDREPSRQATAKWLRERVFVEQPLSGNHALDACRARLARYLAKELSKEVKAAYGREQPRNQWESAMDILQEIATYISKLAAAVTQAHDEGADLSREIEVESDEAKALLPSLGEVLLELEEWESETVLPTRSMGVRQSVEIDETDDVGTEDEDDFEEFEDLSQGV